VLRDKSRVRDTVATTLLSGQVSPDDLLQCSRELIHRATDDAAPQPRRVVRSKQALARRHHRLPIRGKLRARDRVTRIGVITMASINLARGVTGTISPYPTVVIVITLNYKTSTKDISPSI
jgi:hypothetical protein